MEELFHARALTQDLAVIVLHASSGLTPHPPPPLSLSVSVLLFLSVSVPPCLCVLLRKSVCDRHSRDLRRCGWIA